MKEIGPLLNAPESTAAPIALTCVKHAPPPIRLVSPGATETIWIDAAKVDRAMQDVLRPNHRIMTASDLAGLIASLRASLATDRTSGHANSLAAHRNMCSDRALRA